MDTRIPRLGLRLNPLLVKQKQIMGKAQPRTETKPHVNYNLNRKVDNSPNKKRQLAGKTDKVIAPPIADNSKRALPPNDYTVYTVPCSNVVLEVERLKEERERRRAMQVEQRKKIALLNQDPDNPNWEVALMVRNYREQLHFNPLRALSASDTSVQPISVCVRKRPMSRREMNAKVLDIVSVISPNSLIVHAQRNKVDLSKILEHHKFRFDYTFDEKCTNAIVYGHTARPLIRTMFEGGNATCFAYGQTGSGKTHTMGGEFRGKTQDCTTGIYGLAARDIFQELTKQKYLDLGASITCSYFEIYGSKVHDLLLPDKPLLRVVDDSRQQVVIVGLTQMPVTEVAQVMRFIEQGNRERSSGQTAVNMKSSRSHAVFQLALVMPGASEPCGKFSFVDLAGNERGADTQAASQQTRREGAEINKSLLALKECIRALSRHSAHLSFRGSKLTQVLRDSFIGGKRNKTCMIAMISPGQISVENSLNTLRYADRVKELVIKDDRPDVNGQNLDIDCDNKPFELDTNLKDSVTKSDNSDAALTDVIMQHQLLFHFTRQLELNFESIIKNSQLNTKQSMSKFMNDVDFSLGELQCLIRDTRHIISKYNEQHGDQKK